MSTIDFPNDPQVDDEYSFGRRTWKWTGEAWQLIADGLPGPTGPAGPSDVLDATFTDEYDETVYHPVFVADEGPETPYIDGTLTYAPSEGELGVNAVDLNVLKFKGIDVTDAIKPEPGQFSWDNTSTTTAVAKPQVTAPDFVIQNIHDKMRGCLLLDNGTVNYYLDAEDWTKKADGSASTLTGADGMVMVEIPKFYVKNGSSGDIWKPLISPVALDNDYEVHPAFIKDGAEVPYRYYSAYDCAAISGSTVIETDNNNNQSDRVNTGTDKLISVSGVYPMAGLRRSEFRLLAANRGSGWRMGDFALWSAVNLLLIVEAQTLDSQTEYGVGNTRHTTWPEGGTFADNNRTVQSGAGNSIGNGSGGLATGTINTSNNGDFVKYRGIENFWGNVNNWTDGIVLYSEGDTAGNKVFAYWNNNTSQFADVANADPSTSIPTGYSLLGEIANTLNVNRTSSQFSINTPWALQYTDFSTTGSHGTTDLYRTSSGWRVLRVSGNATNAAVAGAFTFDGGNDSNFRFRNIGARLAF